MKNRIIGALLAALMLLTVLPFAAVSAFADGDSLTITKNGSPATENVDYEWDGTGLFIFSDGITLSGNIENGLVYCYASDLTFDNFSIAYADDDENTVLFVNDCVLYLKGNNSVSNTNGSFSAIYSGFKVVSLEIAGDGNLDVYSKHDGIFAEDAFLTVSASGMINVEASHTALDIIGLNFKETANMLFLRGNNEEFGAAAILVFEEPRYLVIRGSADYADTFSSVTEHVALPDEDKNLFWFTVGEGEDAVLAKSLVFFNPDHAVVSLGAKVNTEKAALRLGARYNGFLLTTAERASVEDLGMLFYPSHLLGENTLDLANANAVRMSATAIEEFDDAKKFVDYDTFTFYVTIVGIPEKGKNTNISFRPYIIYDKGTVYGDVLERSYNDVVNANRGIAIEQGDNEISCPENWFGD